MTVGGLASFGLPATSGFIAEFLSFYGMWLRNPVLALLSVCGIVLTAVYVLRIIQRVFLGDFRPAAYADLGDARAFEWPAIAALAALLVVVGLWPRPLVRLIGEGIRSTLPAVAAARSAPRSPAAASARAGHAP
jgi:NADH-quinone oxidoreductase subunit M